MTKEQAQQIGQLIATARRNRSWSLRRLSMETGYTFSWHARLERGVYFSPAPEKLRRITEVLGMDPERIDRVVKGMMSDGLPGMRTYFRTKYELGQKDIDVIERTVEDIQRKHKDTER